MMIDNDACSTNFAVDNVDNDAFRYAKSIDFVQSIIVFIRGPAWSVSWTLG